MTDLQAFVLFSAVLLVAVALGEVLRAWAGWSPENSRRAVHAGVGLATALCPPLFSGPGLIYILAILFVGVNVIAVRRRIFPGMHAITRSSWGTVTFPLALIIALALCWTLEPSRVYVLQVAFVVLALADPAASLIGTSLSKPGVYSVAGERKSIAGSVAFVIVAFAGTAVTLAWIQPPGFDGATIATAACTVAVIAALAEALGRKGWDNVLIVIAVIIVLSGLDARRGTPASYAMGLVVAGAFTALAYRMRSLDLSGAMAAAILAWMVVAFGGLSWIVPAIAFFVLSSMLSVLGRRRKADAEALAEKGSRRDSGQVLANGGVAGAILAAFALGADASIYWGFVGAFAAASADTWGTEVGTMARGRTRLIAFGRSVPPGTSGGMSLAGTFGALLGAASVVASAWLVADEAATGAVLLGWVLAGAIAAAFLDSVLGATVQARYRLPDGSLTEKKTLRGQDLELAAGFRWIGNDAVNMACTAFGGLVPLLLG